MKKGENPQEQKEKAVLNQDVSAKAQKASEVDQSNTAGEPADAAELKGKIAELETSVELYKDQLLRKAADFENYKKRVEHEIVNLTQFANETLIAELLPILDDFTRSLTMSRDRKDFEVFRRGVELIYSKFLKILEAQGVKPFDSIGKPFDVGYHDALMQLSKEGVPPNTVIEEVEKGYKLHDKVIRHAKVIVSQEPTQNNEGETREKVDRRSESDENTGEL
ncbi:MAG: nucleotide exchange factor GrpE [Bacteroidota bacterium]